MYMIAWVAIAGAIYGMILGVQKMIRVILANYILGSIILSFGLTMQQIISLLQIQWDIVKLGLSYTKRASLIQNSQLTVSVIIYIFLLIIVTKKSQIYARMPYNAFMQNIIYILVLPLLVSSILIISILIIFTTGGLPVSIIPSTPNTQLIYKFIQNLPLRVLIHSILTLFITLELKFSIQTKSSASLTASSTPTTSS